MQVSYMRVHPHLGLLVFELHQGVSVLVALGFFRWSFGNSRVRPHLERESMT